MNLLRAAARAAASAIVIGACLATPTLPAPRRLTLADAVDLAFERSNTLVAARAEVAGERGRAQQAGFRRNPEIGVDVENFGGRRDARGFDAAEVTVAVVQPIELGGKRRLRTAAGEAATSVAEARLSVARLDLELRVRRAFAEALAAETRIGTARTAAATAREVAEASAKLVAGGRVPPLNETRARVEQSGADSAVVTAVQQADAARRALALLWGDAKADIAIAGTLDRDAAIAVSKVPGPGSDLPDVVLARLDLARTQAVAASARTARTPDPALRLGVRRLNELGATALVAGVGITLPLFDRGSGNIAAAEADISRATAALAQAEADAASRAIVARSALTAAQSELAALDGVALPGAEEGLRVARIGFAAGRFGYLELLDAQRALALARRQQVDARLAIALRAAELDRAIGRSINEGTRR